MSSTVFEAIHVIFVMCSDLEQQLYYCFGFSCSHTLFSVFIDYYCLHLVLMIFTAVIIIINILVNIISVALIILIVITFTGFISSYII